MPEREIQVRIIPKSGGHLNTIKDTFTRVVVDYIQQNPGPQLEQWLDQPWVVTGPITNCLVKVAQRKSLINEIVFFKKKKERKKERSGYPRFYMF